MLEELEIEDAEKILDLTGIMKTSHTLNMDAGRFQCVLGPSAMKQKNAPRQYLKSLPFYIEEKENGLS